MKLGDELWHKRLGDFEPFDKITLEVVPRYKTSGLSGDEWRQSVRATFYFKGEAVHEDGWTSMDYALKLLAGSHAEATGPIPTRVVKMEETRCDQPSCEAPAVGRLRIKRTFSRRGEELVQDGVPSRYYRKFCRKHIRRGDCGREDCDANYEPIDGVSADNSSNVEESPSSVMMSDGTIIDPPMAKGGHSSRPAATPPPSHGRRGQACCLWE